MAADRRTATRATEERVLLLAVVAGLVLAVLAVVWGSAAGSQIVLLDGLYAFIGLALSWLAMRAGRLIEAGPTDRHPFGRETLGPLVVGVQGFVLLGSLGYAALEAVQTILAGGSDTQLGSALVFSVINLIATTFVFVILHRASRSSELVYAESVGWRVGVVLGTVMLLGFGGALLLGAMGLSSVAHFVDPVLVLIAAAVLAPTPVRMIRSMLRELLEAAPGPEVREPVERAVSAVREQYGLPEPDMRLGKLGRKIYVELDFFVGDTGWTVVDVDRIRRSLTDLLTVPDQVLWLNVELHADPQWDA